MSRIKIFTIIFALTSVGLAYYLFNSINTSIVESKRIATMETAVIGRLKMIRDAEIGYKSVKGSYTSDWDQLLNFIA